MQWSNFQTEIFKTTETILDSKNDLVILARAGTGKTTTMVEAVIRFCRRNPNSRVLTCAFNVKNAKDLQAKLDRAGLDWKTASAKTLNGVGLGAVTRHLGKSVQVTPEKGRQIAKAVCGESKKAFVGATQKLATLAKITLASGTNDLYRLGYQFNVADSDDIDKVVPLAQEALDKALDDQSCVDFDDQLWFPPTLNLTPWQHDLVVVDEAQDMNPSQLWLARRSVKKGGRLIAVGDDRQAIYAWRGADSGFLDRMTSQLGARTLKLPVTYRCGKKIVDTAKTIVPDYEAGPANVDGEVVEVTKEKLDAKPGDFVISRKNAPLLGLALDYLKRRIPASIQGRDLHGQLETLIKKSKAETPIELISWVTEYVAEEVRKLTIAEAPEDAISALLDKGECLRTLASESKDMAELASLMDQLFTDQDELRRVTFSTAHRAKGLERDRVWVLRDTFRPESGGQEANCYYVAITRAKTNLFVVRGSF